MESPDEHCEQAYVHGYKGFLVIVGSLLVQESLSVGGVVGVSEWTGMESERSGRKGVS